MDVDLTVVEEGEEEEKDWGDRFGLEYRRWIRRKRREVHKSGLGRGKGQRWKQSSFDRIGSERILKIGSDRKVKKEEKGVVA